RLPKNLSFFLYYFNYPAHNKPHSLSLPDALPISRTGANATSFRLNTSSSASARGDTPNVNGIPAVTVWSATAPAPSPRPSGISRSEEHTSELQSRENLVCRLLLEKKKL